MLWQKASKRLLEFRQNDEKIADKAVRVLRETDISKLAEQAAISRRPPLVVIGEPEWN